MGFIRRHRPAVASGAVLVVAAASLTVFALSANGYPVQHVELNDGGVWVTNHAEGLFGRINKPAGALDAGFNPPGLQPGDQIDVRQNGAAVVAWDTTASRIFPVDVSAGSVPPKNAGVAIPQGSHMQMAGGTLAVYDPSSGKVWASRVDTANGLLAIAGLDTASKPVASLGKPPSGAVGSGALAVGDDGTIDAISSAGRIATVAPTSIGFGRPTYVAATSADSSLQLTAVGSQHILFSPASGKLTLPSGTIVPLPPDTDAVLQQPGPAAAAVLVATSKTLLSVTLATGQVSTVYGGGIGFPIAPVRLGDCVYGAWAEGAGLYVQACHGSPATETKLQGETNLGGNPVFRVNRDEIVLNDVANGQVWDLATGQQLANWASVLPPPSKHQTKKKNHGKSPSPTKAPPPKARPDDLGVRAGQTAVLHVLDNDSHPSSAILAIDRISGLSSSSVHLSVAPDEQSVEAVVPSGFGDHVHFDYRIDDGGSQTSSAEVSLHVVPTSDNHVPTLRGGSLPEWTVPEGGSRSIPVLGNWRDADGDNVVLSGARATIGTVTATVDGQLAYTAPTDQSGLAKLTYQVTDGQGEASRTGVLRVRVQSPKASPVRPKAKPDVVEGQVGQPIMIRPFDNDIPGSVPTAPGTTLTLASSVHSVSGLVVVTDPSGTITATPSRAGTYNLTYLAAFGSAGTSRAQIRVDAQRPAVPLSPVAMPDTAVVHGQNPVVVDVLANDYDPAGGVLVVQTTSVPASGQLQVEVLAGRWLQINAITPQMSPKTQTVDYTVSDGRTPSATGQVTVTQVADSSNDTPAPQSDFATVRSGQSVTIPVLDNDTDPDGAPLSLVQGVRGAPHSGELGVRLTTGAGGAAAGTAFVAGRVVRYVAPVVRSQQTAVFEYVVQNAGTTNNTAVGHVTVTITPPPSKVNPDRAPVPQSIDVRMVAGTTVEIPIPTAGIDPDGDGVTVTGLVAPPTLGRITAIAPSSFTYLAYPSETGSDAFDYDVVDSYGAHAQGAVRIGIVPSGDPQQPVAVPDSLIAAPNSRVNVNVLANDVYNPGDQVKILGMSSGRLPRGVLKAPPARGPIEVTAPADGGTLTFPYSLGDGGPTTTAQVRVTGQAGYDIPPVAADVFAKQTEGHRSVTVDVLRSDSDPDGPNSGLRVSVPTDPAAKASLAGSVTLPVLDTPQTVPYVLVDRGGAAASAVIHVPAAGEAGPQPKDGPVVHVAAGGTATIDVDNYVTAPSGKSIRLTTKQEIVPSPGDGLKIIGTKSHSVTIQALPGYSGPAGVTAQVTDSSTSYNEGLAFISVPVQVGSSPITFSCPTGPIQVAPGATVTRYLPTICPSSGGDPSMIRTYSARWTNQPHGLSLSSDGSSITVTASTSVAQAESGTIAIGLHGAQSGSQSIRVTVTPPPPLVLTPISDTVDAGKSKSFDLSHYVQNAINNGANLHIVGAVTQSTGPRIPSPSVSGQTVTISPPASTHGTLTFDVKVSDATGADEASRTADGTITLQVAGPPAVPTDLHVVDSTVSGQIGLEWTASSYGVPTYYEVFEDPGTSFKSTPTETTASGLTNGQTYTFTVEGCNDKGCSAKSNAVSATPDAVPGAPGDLTVSNIGDGSLTLNWTAAPDPGKDAVNHYTISWGGGSQTVGAGGLSANITGLNNDVVNTFSVVATNNKGDGPPATVEGQTVGKPIWLAGAVTFTPAESASETPLVTVSWTPPDPNGPSPVNYTVVRSGSGGDKTVCDNTSATSCTDDGLTYDGRTYTYTVTAMNAGGQSAASSSSGFEATIAPDAISFTAKATGADDTIALSIDVPKSNGLTSTVKCTASGGGSCGPWTFPVGGEPGQAETVTVPANGVSETITLQDCNGSSQASTQCDAPVSESATAYGPLAKPTISASKSGKTVSFTVTACGNGKDAVASVTSSGGQGTGTTTSFHTGINCQTNSYQDANVGYNKTDSIAVDVADSPRDATNTVPETTDSAPQITIQSVTVNHSPTGSDVTYSAVVCGNGLPTTATLASSHGGNHSASLGSGCVSTPTYTDGSIGYSTTDTITVTASDPDPTNGRSNVTSSGSTTTVGPPPPPQTVSLSASSASANGKPGCSNSHCHFIVVTLSGFSGSVTCSFDSREGPAGFINETFGGNGTYQSFDYYGWSGGWVSASCNGVSSGQQGWP